MKNLIWSTLLLTAGCDLSDDSGSTAEYISETLELCGPDVPSDAIWIEDASIAGEILTVEMGFGGGCQAHQLRLCWDGSVAESAPEQVFLWVSHDANGDSCEAALSETMAADISSIGVSPAIVHLDGWSGALLYE